MTETSTREPMVTQSPKASPCDGEPVFTSRTDPAEIQRQMATLFSVPAETNPSAHEDTFHSEFHFNDI